MPTQSEILRALDDALYYMRQHPNINLTDDRADAMMRSITALTALREQIAKGPVAWDNPKHFPAQMVRLHGAFPDKPRLLYAITGAAE